MSSGTLSERKLKEIEEIAAGWGKLLAKETFPNGPGLDVTLADMEEVAARAARAIVRGAVETMTGAAVVDKIVSANAEHKSTYKAQKMLKKLAELSISVPEILELSSMIGQELREHLEEQVTAHARKPSNRNTPKHQVWRSFPRMAVAS